MQPALLLLAAGESVSWQMERHFSSKISKLFNFHQQEFKLMLDLAHQIKNFKISLLKMLLIDINFRILNCPNDRTLLEMRFFHNIINRSIRTVDTENLCFYVFRNLNKYLFSSRIFLKIRVQYTLICSDHFYFNRIWNHDPFIILITFTFSIIELITLISV